ncbi:MAG: 16S rRNA (guanine(527)-N(7))-methyltransferase RsmG, partial [Lachnospiraceae bacterium]|nr:16S rRNA (guanine(527)-N(7))-methyltransferase RsmG [Lachnospiraceae bacterium]
MNEILINALKELNISFDKEMTEKLYLFYELLMEKNKVMNLTSITDPEEVMIKHFADSLSVLKFCSIKGFLVADLGTGAGFPGIPLAIFAPDSDFVLIDSVRKKLDFISEASEKLGLTNISVVHGRAEDISHDLKHREKYDLCLSRAVSNMSTLLELALGLVKPGGHFISYKSDKADEEIAVAAKAVSVMGGSIEKQESLILPGTDISRKLIFIKKTAHTPEKYP